MRGGSWGGLPRRPRGSYIPEVSARSPRPGGFGPFGPLEGARRAAPCPEPLTPAALGAPGDGGNASVSCPLLSPSGLPGARRRDCWSSRPQPAGAGRGRTGVSPASGAERRPGGRRPRPPGRPGAAGRPRQGAGSPPGAAPGSPSAPDAGIPTGGVPQKRGRAGPEGPRPASKRGGKRRTHALRARNAGVTRAPPCAGPVPGQTTTCENLPGAPTSPRATAALAAVSAPSGLLRGPAGQPPAPSHSPPPPSGPQATGGNPQFHPATPFLPSGLPGARREDFGLGPPGRDGGSNPGCNSGNPDLGVHDTRHARPTQTYGRSSLPPTG